MNIDFFISLPKGTIFKLSNASYYKHNFSVCEFSPNGSKGDIILYGCSSSKIKDIVKDSCFGPILKVSPCNNTVNIFSYCDDTNLKYILMKVSDAPSETYYCFENKYLSATINMQISIYSDHNDQGFEKIDLIDTCYDNYDLEDYYIYFPGDYGFISGEDYKKLDADVYKLI